MNCCNQLMSNFSFHVLEQNEKVPHFYCTRCGAHFFRGNWYTKEQWFFYINEMTFAEYQQRQLEADLLFSPHAHELINHSNPEE